jgi:hypothetical protein
MTYFEEGAHSPLILVGVDDVDIDLYECLTLKNILINTLIT